MSDNVTIRYIIENANTQVKSHLQNLNPKENLCTILIEDDQDFEDNLYNNNSKIRYDSSTTGDEESSDLSYLSDDSDYDDDDEDYETIDENGDPVRSLDSNTSFDVMDINLEFDESENEGGMSPYFSQTSEEESSSSNTDTDSIHPPPWMNMPNLYKSFEKGTIHLPKEIGVWAHHEFDRHAKLDPFPHQSLESLMPRQEWEKLKPLEKRIQVNGHKFTIMSSSAFDNSLFRAISNAKRNSEKGFETDRKKIIEEIETNWMEYVTEIEEYFDHSLFQVLPQNNQPSSSTSLLSKFKHAFSLSTTGAPLFLLKAAGIRLNFQYVLIDANDYNGSTTISSSSKNLRETEGPVFYFMRTGNHPESWFYQYLIPIIKAPNFPTSGKFPLFIYDVLQVDRELNFKSKSERSDFPSLMKKPEICFGLDSKTYFYQPTRTHDLWSILSELFFHNIASAERFYGIAIRKKLDDTNYFHYCKAEKRKVKGYGPCPKLFEKYKRSTKFLHQPYGDLDDLQRLADVSNFTYTLLGLDANGNFFWRESAAHEGVGDKETDSDDDENHDDNHNKDHSRPKVSLFVRLSRNRKAIWFALKDCELDYLNEEKVYGKSKVTDTFAPRREFYVQYRPLINNPINKLADLVVNSDSGTFSKVKSENDMVPKLIKSPVTLHSSTATLPDIKMLYPTVSSISSTVMELLSRISEVVTRLNPRNITSKVSPEEEVNDNEAEELNFEDIP